jgi:histidine triad (HIT) family protein
MDDCIFCKIARGDVPSQKAHHEGDTIVSFPDIHPVAPGHTLVIPVAHYEWFYQLPDDISDRLFRACKKIAAELKEQTGADYIHLSIVGKDVPHVHVHLIPRHFGDKLPS